MNPLILDTVVVAAFTGLLFHLLYKRYEPSVKTFLSNTLGILCLWSIFIQYISSSYVQATIQTALFLLVHLLVLGLSITTYRLFFHPLRQYPGPWIAKLTKWVDFYHTAPGKRHEWLPALHEKYGHIVRIGPNELSFSNPGAVKYLHGPQGARLRKGPYYDTKVWKSGDGTSMAGTRDWEDHRIRRRIWDHGFSQKALKSYEPRILDLLDQLCDRLAEMEGRTRTLFPFFTPPRSCSFPLNLILHSVSSIASYLSNSPRHIDRLQPSMRLFRLRHDG